MKYFRATRSEGGEARAARHTPEELRAWGKMGGRPKGSKDAKPRKRGKGPPRYLVSRQIAPPPLQIAPSSIG
jgi:hypothetical protein